MRDRYGHRGDLRPGIGERVVAVDFQSATCVGPHVYWPEMMYILPSMLAPDMLLRALGMSASVCQPASGLSRLRTK